MRKEILIPVFTAVAGAVGFGLRRWEQGTGFEPETGLAIPGAPAAFALGLFSLAVGVALLLLCRGKYRDFSGGYEDAFCFEGDRVSAGALVLCGFLAMGSGALALMDLPRRWETALSAVSQMGGTDPERTAAMSMVAYVLATALSLLTAAACLVIAKRGLQGTSREKNGIWAQLPAFTAGFWMVSAYQNHSGDPVKESYFYGVLAIVAIAVGCYYAAGFCFRKYRCAQTVFFSMGGIYLSLVSLADAHELQEILLYLSLALYLGVHALLLLRADREGERMCPSGEDAERETRQEAGDETTQTEETSCE